MAALVNVGTWSDERRENLFQKWVKWYVNLIRSANRTQSDFVMTVIANHVAICALVDRSGSSWGQKTDWTLEDLFDGFNFAHFLFLGRRIWKRKMIQDFVHVVRHVYCLREEKQMKTEIPELTAQ